jgi:heat shock protein HslJ
MTTCAVLAGCTPLLAPIVFTGRAEPAMLAGEPWVLVEFADSAGRVTAVRARFTAAFSHGGRVGGSAGPNAYGGDYSAGPDGSIRFSDVASTLIGGPEASTAGRYFVGLIVAHRFEVDSRELRIHFGERGYLHFRRGG